MTSHARHALVFCCVALVAGCMSATSHLTPARTSELDVYVYSGCATPSVKLRELKDERGRRVAVKQMPLRLRSGVYAIGLSCAAIVRDDSSGCIAPPRDDPTIDVPTYKIELLPRVHYEFSCLMVNGVWTYEMQERSF